MKKHLITITTTLSAILIVSTVTYAIGALTPTGTAGDDTQYSLNDIYDKLTNFTDTPTATSSPFTVPGSVSASFHTLSEIYGLLEAEEDLVPENIKDGTTIFGVDGTLEGAPAPLEWSTQAPTSLNWNAAIAYCAALTEGDANAGDWRLPTISELLAGISDDWIVEGDNEGDRFGNFESYWSSSVNYNDTAFGSQWMNFIISLNSDKSTEYRVRCTR